MDATVGTLAASLGGEVIGNADQTVTDVQALGKAGPQSISFLGDDTKLRELDGVSAAGILITASKAAELSDEQKDDHTFVIVEDALDAFIQAVQHFRPLRERAGIGISPQAIVAESATIGEDVNIHPRAHIGEDVVIGSHCDIHPGAVISDGTSIGDNVTIYANVVIYPDVEIGNRVIIHAGAVLGADGFGYRFRDGQFEKIPQQGTVQIHDDVEIGANTTIDRGMVGPTIVSTGTKLDNLVMVAHNCEIGRHNAFASQVGIAGSSSTGDYVRAGGQVGLADHLHIGTGASLAAGSGFHKDVPAGETWGGNPARPMEEAIRIAMTQTKLPEMRSTLRTLQKQVAKLTAEIEQLTNTDTQADAA